MAQYFNYVEKHFFNYIQSQIFQFNLYYNILMEFYININSIPIIVLIAFKILFFSMEFKIKYFNDIKNLYFNHIGILKLSFIFI